MAIWYTYFVFWYVEEINLVTVPCLMKMAHVLK
jgi:hypothetical protein